VGFSLLFVILFVVTQPPRNSPLGKLDLEEPVGLFTSLKLSRIRENPAQCRQVIAGSHLQATHVPDETGDLCRLTNAVKLDLGYFDYSAPVTVSCPAAAALYIWEREVVAASAARHLPAAVVEIVPAGSYSCRRRYGKATGPISEHAFGNAVDVAGFKLANGDTVTVKNAWKAGGDVQAFVHEVRDGACGVFQAVLSPDYNAAHHDHLHLDMGKYKLCR
jgi:hypothetical protein